jgi:hypothetical protein
LSKLDDDNEIDGIKKAQGFLLQSGKIKVASDLDEDELDDSEDLIDCS